jgi:uncharacterized membrane protein HdeD (DUF308 family)
MIARIAQYWWLLALRGVLGILFGIVALVWPGITLIVLVAFFGAYMLVDGIVALAAAVRFRHERERWMPLLLEGILGIAIGAFTFFYPQITALAWVYVIAFWAIVTGVFEIIAAVRLRSVIQGEFFLGLTGVLSILLGLAMAVFPGAGLLAWVWLIGIYAIIFGVLLIALAFRVRGLASPTGAATA